MQGRFYIASHLTVSKLTGTTIQSCDVIPDSSFALLTVYLFVTKGGYNA